MLRGLGQVSAPLWTRCQFQGVRLCVPSPQKARAREARGQHRAPGPEAAASCMGRCGHRRSLVGLNSQPRFLDRKTASLPTLRCPSQRDPLGNKDSLLPAAPSATRKSLLLVSGICHQQPPYPPPMHPVFPEPGSDGTCRHPAMSIEGAGLLTQPVAGPHPLPQSQRVPWETGPPPRALPAPEPPHLYAVTTPGAEGAPSLHRDPWGVQPPCAHAGTDPGENTPAGACPAPALGGRAPLFSAHAGPLQRGPHGTRREPDGGPVPC